jgi:predicted DNA-binding transcriptional regulator YafY
MGNHISRTQRLLRLVAAMKRGQYPNACSFSGNDSRSQSRAVGTDAVCEKTILRDIRYLRQHLGAPVEYDAARRGYFLSDAGWSFPSVELRGDALFAALVSLKLTESLFPGTLRSHAESALAIQLAAANPEEISPETLDAVVFATGAKPVLPPHVFDAVNRAWRETRRLHVDYQRQNGEIFPREIDIQALFLADGAWYARAWCHKRHQVRSFALHRMQNPQVLERTFRRSAAIVKEVRSGHVFDYEPVQDVRVHCAAELALLIRERDWFAGQKVIELPTGSLEICYPTVPREPFVRWVLAHAGHLRVLGPTALRDEVRKAAEELFWHHYDDSRTGIPDLPR